MRIEAFSPDRLSEVVELLNRAIAGRRAATTVSEKDLSQRVLSHPGLDRAGLLLAVDEAGRVAGLIHAIIPPVHLPDYARLAGTGFVMGPYVAEAWRTRGLGRSLLRAAEDYLHGQCERIQVHGLRTPFYHAQEGPRQPFCGSTEMIGLCADDAYFLNWLSRAGYVPVPAREVSMVARVERSDQTLKAPRELRVIRVTEDKPWTGTLAWKTSGAPGYGYETYGPCRYDTLALTSGQTIIGHCQWYPMRKPGRAALYDLRLAPSWRGHGLGRFLFLTGLQAMADQGYREVELHTSPERNAIAHAMYRASGFVEVENWIVMEKLCGT